MTDANSEGFPICDERITENDRCVIKIIGIHCILLMGEACNYRVLPMLKFFKCTGTCRSEVVKVTRPKTLVSTRKFCQKEHKMQIYTCTMYQSPVCCNAIVI